MIKYFTLLSLIVSMQAVAKWSTHTKMPEEIVMLIDYISADEDISIETLKEISKLNMLIQKAHSNSKSDAYFSLELRWVIRNSFYKWFLIKASTLEKGKKLIPISQPLSKDFAPYEQWIYKNVYNDIENIIVNYSRKKVTYGDLSKIAQKKISLLTPWVALFKRNTLPKMLRSELLPLTLDHLTYINKQVSAFNILSNYSNNKPKKVSYISKITEKTPSTNKVMTNKNPELPTPVDDWGNQDRYKKEKPTGVGKDGLPLPVDDWILDY